MQSDMYVCIYTHSSQYTDAGRAKEILKHREGSNCRAKEIFPRDTGSPALALVLCPTRNTRP